MNLEPVLLKAPLAAVLDRLSLALGTCVEWDKLLVEVGIVVVAPHFEHLFQRAHFIATLAHMNHLVVRRYWNRLWQFFFGVGCLFVIFLFH